MQWHRSALILSTAMAVKGYLLAVGTALFTTSWSWPLGFIAAAMLFTFIALALRMGSQVTAYRRGYHDGAGDFRQPSGTVRQLR